MEICYKEDEIEGLMRFEGNVNGCYAFTLGESKMMRIKSNENWKVRITPKHIVEQSPVSKKTAHTGSSTLRMYVTTVVTGHADYPCRSSWDCPIL